MYYSYIKKKSSELSGLGVHFEILAIPPDNPNLVTSKFVQKVIEAQNPLVVVEDKCYEITSDTEHTLKKTLTAPDYYGESEQIDNYPAEGYTYKQYYYEQEAVDDTVVARLMSSDPFNIANLITYTQAVTEGKSVTENSEFTFSKTTDEIKWERINRLNEIKVSMTKRAALLSELSNIAAANAGYDMADIAVDTFLDASLLDPYNSDTFDLEEIDDELVMVAQGEGSEFVVQSIPLSITASHCFVMGYCISGNFTVEVSNDGGSNWETATFDEVSKSKISDEIDFTESPTGSLLIKLTMQKGDLGYNPILSGWGILWKNV